MSEPDYPYWAYTPKVAEETTHDDLVSDLFRLLDCYKKRNIKHDPRFFINGHEGYGAVKEEVNELEGEIHINNLDGQADEAMDIAVAAFHLYRSAKNHYKVKEFRK